MHRTSRWSVAGACVGFAAAAASAWGADVTGRVTYQGTPPERKPIPMPANQPQCQRMHQKNPLLHEDLPIVGKGGGLKNVFVQVKSGLDKNKKWPVPANPVDLTQEGCHYMPHVFGVMAGQGIQVINGDATNHNIHGLCKKNKEFNFSQPQKGMKKVVMLNMAEDFKIKCDVHDWMNAYCFVISQPFFAVTDADGKYTIKDLPAGEYELEFWHESPTLVPQVVKVKIEAGKNAVADARFAPKSKAPIPQKKA